MKERTDTPGEQPASAKGRGMAEYGEWNRKGATLSDVTATKEYGVSRDFIVKGIRGASWPAAVKSAATSGDRALSTSNFIGRATAEARARERPRRRNGGLRECRCLLGLITIGRWPRICSIPFI